jgi:hypothetical protein
MELESFERGDRFSGPPAADHLQKELQCFLVP